MPSEAWKVLQRTGVQLGKHRIPASRVKSLSLAVLTYSGSGKYNHLTRCVRWSDLPEGTPPAAGGPEPSFAPPPPPFGPPLPFDIGGPMAGPIQGLIHDGWWPVTVLEFSEDGEFQALVGTAAHVLTQTVCVVCIYQWGWPTPYAWQVTMQR